MIRMTPTARTAALIPLGALALLTAGCGGDAASSGSGGGSGGGSSEACAPEDVRLVGQVRNQTNPYEASWLEGGDAFAESVGLEQQKLTYDGESPKQQEQIRQILATGDARCLVMNVLPNNDSDTTPIVTTAVREGAWVVTQWNKPADLHPYDEGNEHWVAHLTYDGEESGYQIATAMFEQMGGTGGVIALQGVLDTAAAQDRFAGLERALSENSGIELLDQQAADFDRATALTVTQTLLTKHGDAVKGVWAANDDMALGALQALEAAGRTDVAVVGIDAVPEAVQAVQDGTMTATVSSDGPWQGGIGLAMGFCAATGEIDPASMPDEEREFFAEQFLVTAENAAEFLEPEADPAEFACDSLASRVAGPIE